MAFQCRQRIDRPSDKCPLGVEKQKASRLENIQSVKPLYLFPTFKSVHLILSDAGRKQNPQVAIMRSIPIAPAGRSQWVPTLKIGDLFEPASDLFLTDTLLVDQDGNSKELQPVNGFVGITGQTCDWEMAAALVQRSRIPVILAGGLSPDNVFDGIVKVKPAGVDSCTGTNMRDDQGRSIRFQKDWAKVRHFVDETRRAQTYLEQQLT